MRASLACLAVSLLALLAAGCTGPSPALGDDANASDDPSAGAVGAATGPDESETEFGWLAAVEAPVVGNAQLMSRNAASLDVSEGRSILRANVTWSCAADPCDLHLYLCSPEDEPNACSEHTMGPSPLALEVSGPMPGEWVAALLASVGNAEVSGTIALTAA